MRSLIEGVIAAGRSMTYYWALCEHVSAETIEKVKDKKLKGLFYSKDMEETLCLDEKCKGNADLLMAIMKIDVEAKRIMHL